jgi:hypothetical protein
MINHLKAFKHRVIFGSMLLAITLWGIPFIPFIPVIVLFGGFNDDNGVNSGVANGMVSLLMTVILGIVVYATILITIITRA